MMCQWSSLAMIQVGATMIQVVSLVCVRVARAWSRRVVDPRVVGVSPHLAETVRILPLIFSRRHEEHLLGNRRAAALSLNSRGKGEPISMQAAHGTLLSLLDRRGISTIEATVRQTSQQYRRLPTLQNSPPRRGGCSARPVH